LLGKRTSLGLEFNRNDIDNDRKNDIQKEIQQISEKIKNINNSLSILKEQHKVSFINFIESLQSLSGESPEMLAKYILKYAKMIENTNPNVSKNLINIVKSIRG
jgi:hypothetical protein